VTDPTSRPMNSWVRSSPKGRWHQAEYDSRTDTAVLCCSGRIVNAAAAEVMDYRWRPVAGQCYHPPCNREVGA
jgi:hypothetical protein